MEEHHARDLDAYYHSLAVHPHHNYYEGRAEADLTAWVEYFMTTLQDVFVAAREEALIGHMRCSAPVARALLHEWVDAGWLEVLDPSSRNRAYGLSAKYRQCTGKDLAALIRPRKPIPP